MISFFLDAFFPRKSLTGDEGQWVSAEEMRSLSARPVILESRVLRARGLDAIDRIVAAAEYDQLPMLHRAMHIFKYKRVSAVGEALGEMLTQASIVGEGSCPVLVPVPLHWLRRFSRGFNQAELLARIVGRKRGWDVKSLLRRTRWTGSQVGRTRAERLVGVKDAFHVRSTCPLPMSVVLVDDLSTTGATLNECARALKIRGVKNVEGLVVALG